MNLAYTIIYCVTQCVFPPILRWNSRHETKNLFCKTFQLTLVIEYARWPFLKLRILTHYRIDSFRILRQSFCGKFEFSADFFSKLIQFFGGMSVPSLSLLNIGWNWYCEDRPLWRDDQYPTCGDPHDDDVFDVEDYDDHNHDDDADFDVEDGCYLGGDDDVGRIKLSEERTNILDAVIRISFSLGSLWWLLCWLSWWSGS